MAFWRNVVLLVCLAFSLAVAEIVCYNQRVDSNNFRYAPLLVPNAYTITTVSVFVRHSKSPCILGQSYGSNGPVLYAQNGCRATFRVCYEPGNNRLVQCDSNNFQANSCDTGVTIGLLSLYNQDSNSPCIEGDTFNKDGTVIHVSRGCRGSFAISYRA